MRKRFDLAVIGRGLMGTACARHLAEAGRSVALIGPDEPEDAAAFEGPFASHHDAGRITRILAADADWSRLSARSVARYRDIEARSGIAFYHPVGGMMAAPSEGHGKAFGDAFLAVADAEGIAHDRLSDAALAARFTMLRFAPGTRAAWDPAGGWIDPRAMRRAEEALAVQAGATVLRETAVRRRGGEVALGSGQIVVAGHVVVATGGYAGMDALLPRPPRLQVFGRTVAFAEVGRDQAAAFADMPALIFFPEGHGHDLYVLPPILYPDGRWLVKIGGESTSPSLGSAAEMAAWFRGGGSVEAGRGLLRELARLMPDLPMERTSVGACAVTFTATGKPCIARLDETVTVLTGGNGAGAKCADELGRLGAMVAEGASLAAEGYGCDFDAPAI
ncbi:FAD-dependent oxidoreductase [Roseibacterium sp. SDUM158017]|uniref:NAD(P)/FAD-dependent oxidoreductase n=1 Tax=Roseicyclus salinarum TaxID=3036773 RepID=UPI002414D625|nr:FAD-dependent oxidoreductase [Roseibacterium sp. SDUM158017]MDG4647147.1 FAD-dependent oxidoreductase [Roseibacterium sp. SDUM158017]